jgi:hypothetical protein
MNTKSSVTCTKCNIEKPVSSFYKKSSESGKLRAMCRECFKKYHRVNIASIISKRYNSSPEIISETLSKIACQICGYVPESGRNFIDHDHTTGKIRGLLCFKCNSALGLFKDNKELLLKAIAYLK